MEIIGMLLLVLLVGVAVVLLVKVQGVDGRAGVLEARVRQLAEKADALERRNEWLAEDTDNRLARRKMNIQMLQMRAKEMMKRIRRCEKELGINIKEIEENDER